MKTLITLLSLIGFTLSMGAWAAEPSAQQQKMTSCNQHASSQSLKGDARKSFMSSCLKKDSHMASMTPQQMKMKSCNSEASKQSLKGDARKTFLSNCLKKG